MMSLRIDNVNKIRMLKLKIVLRSLRIFAKILRFRALSSAGLERLAYTEKVWGSNP